jgi:hypothetical protein
MTVISTNINLNPFPCEKRSKFKLQLHEDRWMTGENHNFSEDKY